VAKSAVCEKALNDLVAPLEKGQRELVLEKDGPARLVMPPEIRPEKMQDVVRQMDDALSSPGSVEDRQVRSVALDFVLTVCALAGRGHS
jgi:hypothetical protein